MTEQTKSLFALVPDHWYAWQMLPGYGIGHYYSPIRVSSVEPLKKGNDTLRLDFFNACYAEGVQSFSLEMKILHRSIDYMIVRLIYESEKDIDRCAVISQVTHEWLVKHAGLENIVTSGDEEIGAILDRRF